MKLTKQQKDNITAIGLGAALLIVILWYSVMGMQKDHLAMLDKKRDSLAEKLDQAKELVNGMKKKQFELQSIQEALSEKEAFMASGDLYFWVVTTLNDFIRNNGYPVRIIYTGRDWVIGPSKMIPGFPEPYKTVSYSVQGSAFYHDFGAFLADFENSYPYLRVQSFRMYRSDSQLVESSEESENGDEGQSLAVQKNERLNFEMEIVALTKVVNSETNP